MTIFSLTIFYDFLKIVMTIFALTIFALTIFALTILKNRHDDFYLYDF